MFVQGYYTLRSGNQSSSQPTPRSTGCSLVLWSCVGDVSVGKPFKSLIAEFSETMESSAASVREQVRELVKSLRKLADKLAQMLCGYLEDECTEHLSIEFGEYVEQFENYIEDVCREPPEDKCLDKAWEAYDKTAEAMCTEFCMYACKELELDMNRCMNMCFLKAGLTEHVLGK